MFHTEKELPCLMNPLGLSSESLFDLALINRTAANRYIKCGYEVGSSRFIETMHDVISVPN